MINGTGEIVKEMVEMTKWSSRYSFFIAAETEKLLNFLFISDMII